MVNEGDPAICCSVDGAGQYFDKQNKPDTEREVLCNLTYIWHLK